MSYPTHTWRNIKIARMAVLHIWREGLDLTGATLRIQVREKATGDEDTLMFECDSNASSPNSRIDILDAATADINIIFSATDTATLDPEKTYYFDIEVTYSGVGAIDYGLDNEFRPTKAGTR